MTIANLQDACLKLVVLARARARELQLINKLNVPNNLCQPRPPFQPLSPSLKDLQRRTKQSAVSFLSQMDARMEITASMHIFVLTGSLRCGSESHNLQACARRRQQSSRSSSAKPAPRNPYAKPKGRAADAQTSSQGNHEKKKLMVSLNAKDARLSLQPRGVTSILTRPSSSNQPFVFSADKIQHYMGLIFLRLNFKIQPQNSALIEAEF